MLLVMIEVCVNKTESLTVVLMDLCGGSIEGGDSRTLDFTVKPSGGVVGLI